MKQVIVGAALQGVFARPAVQGVVAHAAVQEVTQVSSAEAVSPALAVNLVLEAAQPCKSLRGRVVVATLDHQAHGSELGRTQGAVGELDFLNLVCRCPRGGVPPGDVQPVRAVVVSDDQGGAAARHHHVVKRNAGEDHSVDGRVVGRLDDGVHAIAQGEVVGVGTGGAVQYVVAGATLEEVARTVGVQPAIERVVVGPALKRVHARSAGQRVVPGSSVQKVADSARGQAVPASKPLYGV